VLRALSCFHGVLAFHGCHACMASMLSARGAVETEYANMVQTVTNKPQNGNFTPSLPPVKVKY